VIIISKIECNKQIVALTRKKLGDAGILDKLDIFPIENVCTRRPRYWKDGDKNLFKVHMWDINFISEQECENEIDKRIKEARQYFGM
jgi:hypothetical protein